MADERLAKRQKVTSDLPVKYHEQVTADGHSQQHIGDQIFQGTVYMGSGHPATQARDNVRNDDNSVLDSLSFEQMDARYQAIDPSSAQTCRWLVEQSEYQRWRDRTLLEEHHGFLWIKGKAGAGKSTLMRHALDEHLERKGDDEHVVSFFFNARGEDLEKSQVGMYRSLIHQILQQPPWQQATSIPKTIAQARQGWTLSALRHLFRDLVLTSRSRGLVCYIDALDECPLTEVVGLLEFFEELGDRCVEKSITFEVCFSSRHYPDVDVEYRELLVLEDQPGHAEDIVKYTQRKLKVQNRSVKQELTAQIRQRARGVFLWVVLVVRILNDMNRRGRPDILRQCLDSIPQELTALFEDILSRGDVNDNLVPLLQWLLYSKRPLKRAELYWALRSTHPFPNHSQDELELIDASGMDRYILDSSKGLVEAAKGKHARVQFIHESVRTYFSDTGLTKLLNTQDPNVLAAKGHTQLRQCCENYLHDWVQPRLQLSAKLPNVTSDARRSLRKEALFSLPFLAYAVESILYHADTAQAMGSSQSTFLLEFNFNLWSGYSNLLEERQYRQITAHTPMAYIMAARGCAALLEVLWNDEIDHVVPGEGLFTLLGAAVDSDSLTTVQMLLARGAYPNSHITPQKSCLNLAIERRAKGIVHALLTAGAIPVGDLDALTVAMHIAASPKSGYGLLRTIIGFLQQSSWDSEIWSSAALDRACTIGDLELVRQLVKAETNMDVPSAVVSQSALLAACTGSHVSIVGFFVERGLSAEIAQTAMLQVCRAGDLKLLHLLLRAGAAPSLTPAALVGACAGGHQQVVDVLLTHEPKAAANASALVAATRRGYFDIMQALLSAGCDPDGEDDDGTTALLAACEGGRMAAVNVLLTNDPKATANASALITASRRANADIIRALLAAGCDPNAEDADGRSAISWACEQGSGEVAGALLDDGAKADNRPGSALYWATWRGDATIMRKLLERGFEVNHLIERPRVAENPNIDENTWLFDSEADPLHIACRNGNLEATSLLIEYGADVNAQVSHKSRSTYNALAALFMLDRDFDCITLGLAAWLKPDGGARLLPIFTLLLDEGADLDAPCGPYRNAIDAVAACVGPGKLHDFLLSRWVILPAAAAAHTTSDRESLATTA